MATAMTTVEIPKTRTIPVWLAVALILLCAGGGGFLAYRFLLGGSNEKIVLLERAPSETIRQARQNIWIMQTANPGGSNGQITFNLRTPSKPRLQYVIIRTDLSREQNFLLRIDSQPWVEDQ